MRAATMMAIAAILAATQQAPARTEAAFAGGGAFSCAQYGNLYQQYPDKMHDTFFEWAQGFMSGLNAANIRAHLPTENLREYKPDVQQIKIDQYCDDHPLASYAKAVYMLYITFPVDAVPRP